MALREDSPEYKRLVASMQPVNAAMTSVRGTIYGQRGTGKSVLGAEIMQAVCPEGKGILHIDTGEGWSVLRNHEHINRKRFMTIPWTTYQDLVNVLLMVQEGVGVFAHIGAIMFDEVSTMVKDDIDVIHGARVGIREDGTIPAGASTVPEWPDYNSSMVRWRRVINIMNKIPNLHFVFLSHEGDRKVKVGRDLQTTGFGPSIPAGTNAKMQEDVTFVGRLTSDEAKDPSNVKNVIYNRMLQVKPANKFEAKTRIATPDVRIPVENVVPWINAWLEAGGEITAPEDVHIVEHEPTVAESVPPELAEAAATADADAIFESSFEDDIFTPVNK